MNEFKELYEREYRWRQELQREVEDLRTQLHRFQTGQEIESDYLCKSDLELLEANEQIRSLQRLGAEAGACVTDLLASVAMWRRAHEAAEARVKELERLARDRLVIIERHIEAADHAVASMGMAGARVLALESELTRLKRSIEVKDGALRAALPALHDASAALDEGDVVTRYAKLYDQVRAALRGEEA